ncbi:hypothetical protein [Paenibacillus contaminans]|uniref:Uncharacterized protein n=1 Tax=Paenibacillus contaminans TaxID=450362 RepID=A0A329LRX0_9BACL|nr:hypothetical protein [Paenibacillus contaminans]RAV10479.1 hypothetical protein DQG23_37805 [Paenibacillus contaminans]
MTKDKWLKWQIGAVGALAIGLLFQQVKGSAAFAKAHEQTLAAKSKAAGSYESTEPGLDGGFDSRAGGGGQTGYNAPSSRKQGTERIGGQRSGLQTDAESGSRKPYVEPQESQQPHAQPESGGRQTRTGRS